MGKRGNPNWGKKVPPSPVLPTATSFEEAAKKLKLRPDQYVHSTRLREWVRRHKDSKFVPEPLLEAWGFDIKKQPFTSHSTTVFRKALRRSG
jgi:hypothetical protein